MWKKASPSDTYPNWYGNAGQWNENAQAKGYKVGQLPRERSIAVYEANTGGAGPVGHVAWVTRVWVDGSTIKYNVIEMNAAVPNGWSVRNNIVWGSGTSFIIGPPGTPVTSR